MTSALVYGFEAGSMLLDESRPHMLNLKPDETSFFFATLASPYLSEVDLEPSTLFHSGLKYIRP